jgi:hypothetical protein
MASMRTLLALLLLTPTAIAGPPPELAAKRVKLVEKTYDVAEVLSALKEQTENPHVLDRRSPGSPAKVTIGFADLTFWEALDLLAQKLEARVSPFTEEGVALVDGPGHVGKVAYAGICRAEIQTIDVRLDATTDRRTCSIEMEIAWEPRFEPLYLWLDEVAGAYGPGASGKVQAFQRSSRVLQTAPRGTARVDVTLDGPERSVAKVDKMDVRVGFLGPTKMLRFAFVSPEKDDKKSQSGIDVKIADVRAMPKSPRWSIEVLILNPEKTPNFESYQSWLGNNRIHLEKDVAGKVQTWSPNPVDEQIDELSPRRARIRYGFNGAANRGLPKDWTLVLRTPGPIVEFTLPLQFRDVPLP